MGIKKWLLMLLSLVAVACFFACSSSGSGGGDEGDTDTTVVFSDLTADGSANATTTKLTLKFDKDIAGFSVSDIEIEDIGATGTTKNTLTKVSGETGKYELTVSGIVKAGSIKVEIDKDGYDFTPDEKTVAIYYKEAPADIAVTISSLIADGSDSVTTTKLTFTFDKDITGLTADDITLDDVIDSTKIVKGTLTKVEGVTGVYELGVSGIIIKGEVSVSVVKDGYAIQPTSKIIVVYYKEVPADIAVKFSEAIADGSYGNMTTKLTLTFDKDIVDFSVDDITLRDYDSTKIVKGALTKVADTTGVYELTVSGITKSGDIAVSVKKDGYVFSTMWQITVYYAAPAAPLKLVTVDGMGTGGSDLGSYLDLDSMKVYKVDDISTSDAKLQSLDLVFGGGNNGNKIASPAFADGLTGIWSEISGYDGDAQLIPVVADAWDNSITYDDLSDYVDLDDAVTEPIAVANGDVFAVYTTEGDFVLIKVNQLTTGGSPILSLKAKVKDVAE